MEDRRPGHGRYARDEREQRWVLRSLPDGAVDPVWVEDRYLTTPTGDPTGLRLRSMSGSGATIRKLGQKVWVDARAPATVRITNLYLDDADWAALVALPGRRIAKHRWRVELDGRPYGVDVFAEALEGLVLAETDLLPDEAAAPPPPGAVCEVTTDPRFTGGELSRSTAEDLARLLRSVGLRR